jgi:hypothetical protein
VALVLLAGCKKKPAPGPVAPPKPAATAARTNTPGAVTNVTTEFVSFFDDRLPPENSGRDPFNPQSTYRTPAPPVPTKATASSAPPADSQLILRGVVGKPGRRMVTINNQILTVQDPPTPVRVPGGTVTITVIDIGEDYADIKVEGVSGTKRLTQGQKK